jgi:hypothetical protein
MLKRQLNILKRRGKLMKTKKVNKLSEKIVLHNLLVGRWTDNVYVVSMSISYWYYIKEVRGIGPGSWRHPGRSTASENGFINAEKQKENENKNRKLNNNRSTPRKG